jgi:DNA-binding MarR family transcriptional regulator
MAHLNEIIHQPVRLRIMAALVALDEGSQMEFTYLRDLLELTDGNLGAHLRKLEEEKYVDITKTFVARKPRTYVAVTKLGRQAFDNHVAALETILHMGDEEEQNP